MSTDWYSAGFDPTMLPAGLRPIYDYWLAQSGDGAIPSAAEFNPLALPASLLEAIGIFDMGERIGSGQGRFLLAGSILIDFYGSEIGTRPLMALLHESRTDMLEDIAELFTDEDSRLPVFAVVTDPVLRPGSVVSVLVLPLRREPGEPRLTVIAYAIEGGAAAT